MLRWGVAGFSLCFVTPDDCFASLSDEASNGVLGKGIAPVTLFLLCAGDVKQEPGMYREGPTYQRRGSLQLWQFLVALLDDPSNSHFIAWTGRGMEFKLIEPEEVS